MRGLGEAIVRIKDVSDYEGVQVQYGSMYGNPVVFLEFPSSQQRMLPKCYAALDSRFRATVELTQPATLFPELGSRSLVGTFDFDGVEYDGTPYLTARSVGPLEAA